MKEENIMILTFDSNIFLTGIDFNLINGIIYTTPKIIDEIKVDKYLEKNRNILNRIQAAIDSKKLIIKSPSDKYIQEIEFKSKLTGDYKALSDADKELIALTLELINTLNRNTIIYTNDYSMENLCSELNIPFSPLMGKKGIKLKIIWEVYCPFCKDIRKSEDLNEKCEICGSKLKRRVGNRKFL
ncbi:MAG: NOB1 family endonuclease [Promethearchaeota archaeon]